MRLICPNCGAQYEVPQSVIPEAGRDVQCSSCGHTWFQTHPDMEPAAEDDAASANFWDDEDDDDDRGVVDQPAPRPAAVAQDDAAGDEWEGFPTDPGLTDAPHPGTDLRLDPEDPVSRLPDVAEDDYEEDPANDLPPPRRGLDTSVADLLREEAEREARARAAERGPLLESQPDLGLDSAPAVATTAAAPQDDDASRRSEEARLRMARLRGEEARTAEDVPQRPAPQQASAGGARSMSEDDRIAAAAAAAVADSRRGLLPDIEEINSSLRHTSERRPARADDHATPGTPVDPRDVAVEKPRGFSRGFSVTLLFAVLLLALYVFAPALAEAVPALTPAVEAYVGAVDGLRLMLDAQAQKLSRWLADLAGSTS